ncbi:hypothetical protein OESDEN_15031 [Oesophagostomum dentatum]|uniref:Uncharacterized protein n=1 Tax=Oesophagostomum dentatum TaxID=61180 RepID=A0A0B1SP02_OESDE|nr:hypothetical protein OESDEN_15031 [Oesophagostomum dentatum]
MERYRCLLIRIILLMSVWNHLLCTAKMIHKKCRVTDVPYLRSKNVFRFNVPDEKVRWSVEFPEYNPPDYTDPNALGKKWADPDVKSGKFKWNSVDGKINRKSFVCDYAFDEDSRPINPVGRTGLRGRGVLGRWGPNHAADPIVTRIKNGKLQFVAIERHDTGEWGPNHAADPIVTRNKNGKLQFVAIERHDTGDSLV